MIDFTTWTQRNAHRGLVPEAVEDVAEDVWGWAEDAADDLRDWGEDVSEAVTGLAKQVGGTHYAAQGIEPIEYILANNMGYCEGNVIKYVTRHKLKNGKDDILKAIHYLEFILDDQYGDK